LQALERWEGAVQAYREAVRLDPGSVDARFSLGCALQSLNRHDEAAGAYGATLRLQSDHFAALNNLGNCHQRCGRYEQAAEAYSRGLALSPAAAGTLANLGTVLQELGRLGEAVALLRRAAELEPAVTSHRLNLGLALCRSREFAAAATLLREVLEREEHNADAAFNLGNALHGLGERAAAAGLYRRTLALRPGDVNALINLGNVAREQGELETAEAAYVAALDRMPESVSALNNLSCLRRSLGRYDEAEQLLRRGLDVHPQHAVLLDNLGSVLKDAGDIEAAIECFRESVERDPGNPVAHGNLAYALTFQSPDAAPILEECRRWNERFTGGLGHPAPFGNVRNADRRLRIGYVSPDFRDHCQSLFTLPLLSHHDHATHEIVCYSSVERPDALTKRIAGHADVWREVGSLDDAALAAAVRADGIDILVDLTMHMARGRPLLFARKPAPVQIAWLAYPGTTGLAAMDYRLSDGRLDPPGAAEPYSERTLRLPDSFWCYDPLTDEPKVGALPAAEHGFATFGCLNNPCKLTDATFRLWGRVLRRLPDTRLRLQAPRGLHRDRLAQRLAGHGIAPERVDMVDRQPRAEYLRAYHGIDVCLDTVPYGGHTTTLDALWMGVPTVTRVTDTCVGRATFSQLHQLDLLHLAAHDDDAFVDAAVKSISDLGSLAALRRELRPRLERSPLMDGPRFARNVEAVYRRAWSAYCTGDLT
jgi:predicted O-linked N-acetylglucosamine transferase (SPINDLY family)